MYNQGNYSAAVFNEKRFDMKTYSLHLLIIVLLVSIGTGCDIRASQPVPAQIIERPVSALPNRSISEKFQPKLDWHKDDIYIRNILMPSPGIISGYGMVAYVNFRGGELSAINQLEVLNGVTGDALLTSDPFPDYEDFAISKMQAFVLLNEGEKLNIYDFPDGHSYSDNTLDLVAAHTKFFLFPPVVNKKLSVYYNWESEYFQYKINILEHNVSLLKKIKASSPSELFLFESPFFLVVEENGISWFNYESGELLWKMPVSGRIESWPILEDNLLVISIGSIKRMLIAIDIINGKELWRTKKIFGSNVVWYKDGLYTLRNDATLVRLDPKTGQVEEEIFFHPDTVDAGQWAYWLASDENRLFIYFGDSQELFALDLTN